MPERLNTGTTEAFTIMLGRKYIGYELEPKHNSVQVGRFNDVIEKYNQAQINKAA